MGKLRLLAFLTRILVQTTSMATAEYDPANIGRYQTSDPNTPIRLFSGPIKIGRGSKSVTKPGTIDFKWVPNRSVEFDVPGVDSGAFWKLGPTQLSVPSLGIKGAAAYVTTMGGKDWHCGGYFLTPIVVSTGQRIARLMAHVPNFVDFHGTAIVYPSGARSAARLTLRSADWRVTIDATEDVSKLRKRARMERGSAITHVLVCERNDGIPFDAAVGMDVIHAVGSFLSFVAGHWCRPILSVGFDSADKVVFEEWASGMVGMYRGDSWCPDELFGNGDLGTMFSRFMELWLDPGWRVALDLAVYWYITSNETYGIDAAMASQQSGLEVLAWYTLVEDQKRFKPAPFDQMRAADRFRALLAWLKVSAKIPPGNKDLRLVSKAQNWTDGPHAQVGFRNAGSHPSRKYLPLLTGHMGAKLQALALCRSYFELAMLRVLRHRGKYLNRARDYRRQRVPWA